MEWKKKKRHLKELTSDNHREGAVVLNECMLYEKYLPQILDTFKEHIGDIERFYQDFF